jgi:Pleckstrin homology domain
MSANQGKTRKTLQNGHYCFVANEYQMSGYLYRKPRRHSTFHRCQAICTSGQLLVFQDTLRKHNGVEIPHIHKERVAALDLQDCYIYSGLITENDLLYTNQTFDNNYPGHHALPRIYLAQDGWTSRDEDTAVCFVIWHPIRKSLFRASEVKGDKTNRMLRRVSALGVPGRTVVFKARSRLERDRWVACIESEINRLQDQRGEDVRII